MNYCIIFISGLKLTNDYSTNRIITSVLVTTLLFSRQNIFSQYLYIHIDANLINFWRNQCNTKCQHRCSIKIFIKMRYLICTECLLYYLKIGRYSILSLKRGKLYFL